MNKKEYIEEILEIVDIVEPERQDYAIEILNPRLYNIEGDKTVEMDEYSVDRLRGMHRVAKKYLSDYCNLKLGELSDKDAKYKNILDVINRDIKTPVFKSYRNLPKEFTVGYQLEAVIQYNGKEMTGRTLDAFHTNHSKIIKERQRLSRLLVRYLKETAPCMRDDRMFEEELNGLKKRYNEAKTSLIKLNTVDVIEVKK